VNKTKGGILALGHGLVDLMGIGSEAFCSRFPPPYAPEHVSIQAMAVYLSELDEKGILKFPLSRRLGGGSAIAACAAKALGTETLLAASFGSDAGSLGITDLLRRLGVPIAAPLSEKPTGVFASVQVPGAGKKLVVAPSAARDIHAVHSLRDFMKPGWVLLVDGLLVQKSSWLSSVAAEACSAGMRLAIDLSTPGNARQYARELIRFIGERCEIVFANEAEYEALRHLDPLSSCPQTAWIEKRGAEGAVWRRGNDKVTAGTSPVHTGDDTGAGDIFAAAYLSSMLSGLDEAACLAAGNSITAEFLRTRKIGGTENMLLL